MVTVFANDVSVATFGSDEQAHVYVEYRKKLDLAELGYYHEDIESHWVDLHSSARMDLGEDLPVYSVWRSK